MTVSLCEWIVSGNVLSFYRSIRHLGMNSPCAGAQCPDGIPPYIQGWVFSLDKGAWRLSEFSSCMVKHNLPGAQRSCSSFESRISKFNLAVAGPGQNGMPTTGQQSKPRASGKQDWTWRNDTNHGAKKSHPVQWTVSSTQCTRMARGICLLLV